MTAEKRATTAERLAAALADRDITFKSPKLVIWTGGEANRKPRANRPCPCGCDERGGEKVIGYVSASDKDGNGFTLYAPDEATFKVFASIFGEVIG